MIHLKKRPDPLAGARPAATVPEGPMVSNSCPYLERNDGRCSSRFSLDRLDQMFEVCLGPGVQGCFMFHRLRREDVRAAASRVEPVQPTHDGQPIPLRPTGS